jgi:hypothetical protein
MITGTYSFRFNGTIVESDFRSYSTLSSSEIFAEIFYKLSSFMFLSSLSCLLHFSSSENVGDEINEDSQHVSCLSVTSKTESTLE